MDQRRCSALSVPRVNPLKGHTYWQSSHCDNVTAVSLVMIFRCIYSLLPGLDWIERENFLDVHLTRNRPPPARRRRSGSTQRTSFRRAGQKVSCVSDISYNFEALAEHLPIFFFFLLPQSCHLPTRSHRCSNSTQQSGNGPSSWSSNLTLRRRSQSWATWTIHTMRKHMRICSLPPSSVWKETHSKSWR